MMSVTPKPQHDVITPVDPEWHTVITQIKYNPGKGPSDLKNQINRCYAKFCPCHNKPGSIKVNLVIQTFGNPDTIMVWQAISMDAAKEFADATFSSDIGQYISAFGPIRCLWKP